MIYINSFDFLLGENDDGNVVLPIGTTWKLIGINNSEVVLKIKTWPSACDSESYCGLAPNKKIYISVDIFNNFFKAVEL